MKQKEPTLVIWISILVMLAICSPAQNINKATLINLNFAFPKSALPDLNERDAKAAIKLWSDEIVENYHYNYQTEIFIYQNVQAMMQGVEDKQVNIFALPTMEYLRFREFSKKVFVYPAICSLIEDTVFDQFLILVKKGSGIANIHDLSHKSLVIKNENYLSAKEVWLDVILGDNGLPFADDFFSKMIRKDKESQLIFPVLLDQADACIIALSTFKTLSDLNPQLKIQLIPIIQSEPYLGSGIFCYSSDLSEKSQNDVTSFALKWDKSKATDQLQKLFRIKDLVAYDPHFIESSETLLQKYDYYHGKR